MLGRNLERQGPLTGEMGCCDLAISPFAKPHIQGLLNGRVPTGFMPQAEGVSGVQGRMNFQMQYKILGAYRDLLTLERVDLSARYSPDS
jgi:hypothetical protein